MKFLRGPYVGRIPPIYGGSRWLPYIVVSRGCADCGGYTTVVCFVVWSPCGYRRMWLS